MYGDLNRSMHQIPVRDQSMGYSNSLKNNRIAPHQQNQNMYGQSNYPFVHPSTTQSSKAFMNSSHMNSLNPRRPYSGNVYNPAYPQDKYMEGNYPDDDPEEKENSESYCSQKICFGLTRLNGCILFGTMTILGLISIGGLVTSVLLYIIDSSTNSQWKVLGIVVSSVMLLTILITLCIFLYCYKNGRINENGNKNNMGTSGKSQSNEYDPRLNYNQSYNASSIPYGNIPDMSPLSTVEDIIQVKDKQTNTEATMAPLRPRDYHRGVWAVPNAYGGIYQRPYDKPMTTNHYAQASPNEIDQAMSQYNNKNNNNNSNNIFNAAPQTIVHLPENSHRHRHHLAEHRVNPSNRPIKNEYLDFLDLPQQLKTRRGHKMTNIGIRYVKPN